MFGRNYTKILKSVAELDNGDKLYAQLARTIGGRCAPKWVGGGDAPEWGRGDSRIVNLLETLLSPRNDWELRDRQFPYTVYSTSPLLGWQGYLGVDSITDSDSVMYYARDAEFFPCVERTREARPTANAVYCIIGESSKRAPASVEFWPGEYYKYWGEDEWAASLRRIPNTPDWDHSVFPVDPEKLSTEEQEQLKNNSLAVGGSRARELGARWAFII